MNPLTPFVQQSTANLKTLDRYWVHQAGGCLALAMQSALGDVGVNGGAKTGHGAAQKSAISGWREVRWGGCRPPQTALQCAKMVV